MMQLSKATFNPSSNNDLLLAYVADLELEVDRLRKHYQVVQHEGEKALTRIRQLCQDNASPDQATHAALSIAAVAQQFSEVLQDLHESPGYHPAHDQVIAIAVRPLVEQVFRWQQRLLSVHHAVLHLELGSEHVEWFPARLRHILDNLISNALKYRDSDKGETRVSVGLTARPEGFEIRISDNGPGMPWSKRAQAFDLYYRVGPARPAGLGVGVAVVKLLVEQSGGTLSVESGNGQGTSFVVLLPRYDASDFLD